MRDADEQCGSGAALKDAREMRPADRGLLKQAGDADAQLLGDAFGGRWTGVRFLWGELDPPDVSESRLCELIGSANGALRSLTAESCSCPGCSYAFGWRAEGAHTVAGEIHERLAMVESDALALVESLPRMSQAPDAVVVGLRHDADVYASYAQPFAVMKLVRRWQALPNGHGMLDAELSSIMSVCSGAVLAAYLTQRPTLSFGCPESRKAGGLSRDRLVLAVPASLVADLAG